jgi:hypothetical protein
VRVLPRGWPYAGALSHLLGLFCEASNGVVIATEKKLPSVLIDEAHVQKVELINPNTGEARRGHPAGGPRETETFVLVQVSCSLDWGRTTECW